MQLSPNYLIMTSIDFFCRKCRLDQTRPAEKRGYRDSEWWYAICEKCRSDIIRRITDRNKDPYYYESIKLKMERERLKIDLIQKDSTRFKQYYRKQWLEDEKTAELVHNSRQQEKTSRDQFLKDTLDKNFARATIKSAEEIAHRDDAP